jgi:DNA transformation protein
VALDPEQIQELFSVFGRVSVRRMFGGAGIFADGLMIGLISDGDIFLKADAQTIPKFEAEGMAAFTYGAKRRRVVMSYWRMPDRLLDDPEELAEWARGAFGTAQRAAIKTRSRKPASGKRPARSKKSKVRRKK